MKFSFNSSKTYISKRPSSTFDKQHYSLSSTKQDNQKLLSSVRHRNTPHEIQINSEIASKVVREYILPMFHTSSQEKSHAKRRESFGVGKHRRTFSDTSGTLYSELKLSDQLSTEVKKAETELVSEKKNCKELEQKQFEIMSELNLYKETIYVNNSVIAMLNQDNLMIKKDMEKSEYPQRYLLSKLYSYQEMVNELTEERNRLKKLLEEERANNDIRFNSMFFP